MPLYDYDCAQCGRRFEVVHGVHVDGPTECPLCGGGPVRKAITAAAVHYKGSGWAKKERRTTTRSSKSGGEGDGGTSDAGSDKGSAAPAAADTPKTGGAKSDGTKSDAAKTDTAKEATTTASTSD
jgi:putative FmdB family regulatory protein